MRAGSLQGQLVRFALVGIAGTAAFIATFAALRTCLDAQPAAVVARILVAVATSFANARYSFRSAATPVRTLTAGFLALAAGAAVCSFALAVAAAAGPHDRVSEVLALVVANIAAAGLRFTILRAALSPRPSEDAHSSSSTASQRLTSSAVDRRSHSGAASAA